MPRPLALIAVAALFSVAARGDELEEVARRHFETGQRFYRAAHYREALAEFTAGFELTHRAGFLINMAQVHKQQGDWARAAERYQQFLEREPGSPLAPRVRAWLDEARAKAPPPPIAPTVGAFGKGSGEVPTPPPPPIVVAPGAVSTPPPPVVVAPPPPTFWRRRRVATPIAAALTVATAVAAIAVEVVASRRYDSALAECAPVCPPARLDGITAAADAAIGLFAGAGLLAVTTVVLLLAEGRPRAPALRASAPATLF